MPIKRRSCLNDVKGSGLLSPPPTVGNSISIRVLTLEVDM